MDTYAMEESVSRDRLSELPDSLIHLILSFLPMRDVVPTTLLSKRWNNLWTTVPCLNFCESIDYCAQERLRNFVNRVLIMWNGTKILKFEFSIYNFLGSSFFGDMNLWVHFAVRNEVEELKLHFDDELMEITYLVPQCVNSCSSLRKLSLVGCNLGIHGSVSWNQLKSLKIHTYCVSECLINRVLLGSPRLEVFELRLMASEIYDDFSIRSTSLKKLMIERNLYFYCDESALDTMFRICCPNLEILEFSGGLDGVCWFTDVSSSIDAILHFDVDYDCDGFCLNELFGGTLRQVFSTHVEKAAKLDDSNCCPNCEVEVFRSSPKKYLRSPLPNVKGLKLGVRHIEFGGMMDLLGTFPNLKMLVIEGPPDYDAVNYVEYETNLSKSFLLQLKTVEITSQLSDFSIFGFIEFLLKNAIRLEKLVLRSTGMTSYHPKTLCQISEKLLSMPRSSTTAKVILKNN